MENRLSLRAGWTRMVMGTVALVVVPGMFPPMRRYVWLFLAYLGAACVIQWAIHRGVGGKVRVIVGAVLDIALTTFVIQRLGSLSTLLPALYLVIAVLNALAVGSRDAAPVAVMAVLAFAGVQVAEQVEVLTYAPFPPDWSDPAKPSLGASIGVTGLLGVIVLVATTQVGKLVDMVRQHEQELEMANARLEELSQKDPLTQLFNRRHLVAQTEHELERVRRGHELTALMIDLDRFKQVNDRHGHLAGDNLLREIASALERVTRATDVAARYGGDEFLILLTDTDLDQARLVAQRLVDAIREAAAIAEPEAGVTGSVGIALARKDDTVRSLLSRADERAYEAKQAGGDGFVAERRPG